jgi:hypothetical protein
LINIGANLFFCLTDQFTNFISTILHSFSMTCHGNRVLRATA